MIITQLTSNCHEAKPFFTIGFAHGIKMTEHNEYVGICSKCKKESIFDYEDN
jgi:hypothetical protein